jgi:hypothetical protein
MNSKIQKFKKHLKLDYNNMKKQDKTNNDLIEMTKKVNKLDLKNDSDTEEEVKTKVKRNIKPLKFKF